MNTPVYPQTTGFSGRRFRFLSFAWVLIAVKCLLVTWAINHWSVPIHPLWIVAPTLLFAGLATALWVSNRGGA